MSKKIKYITLLLFIIILIILYCNNKFILLWIPIILCIINIVLIFNHEYLIVAMIKYYQGDLANTRKWIYKIHNYKENLFDYEISYLYLLKGVSNLKYDIKKSEQYLLKFLNRDNISNNNKTIANIYLSIIYLNTKKKHKALKLLHKIENNNNKILKETIYKLKKKIKNTN